MVVDLYREKLNLMAKNGDNEILLLTANHWKEGGRIVRTGEIEEGFYKMVASNIFLRVHGASFLYGPKIIQCYRSFKPDIVHVEEEYYSVALFQALFLKGFFQSNSKCIFFTWQNIEKKYPPPFSNIEKYIFNRADGAIAGNQEALEILRKKGFAKPLIVIPQFGVASLFFNGKAEKSTTEIFQIGYAGRIEQSKGIETLLTAVSKLDFEYDLQIIGDGSFKNNLVKISKHLGIQERVKIISNVAHRDMPKYLNQLDVLVLPSKTTDSWKEQFGRVLIEAMGCGVPVIGSNSGAIPEVISDAGLIFNENSPEDLKEKITTIADDINLWKHLSAKGRERVLKNYTTAAIAEETLKFYQEILNRT